MLLSSIAMQDISCFPKLAVNLSSVQINLLGSCPCNNSSPCGYVLLALFLLPDLITYDDILALIDKIKPVNVYKLLV